MRNVVLILILLSTLACNSKNENQFEIKKGIAAIEGKVLNFKDMSKTITFSGENVVHEINQLAIIDSSGNFNAKLELYHPQTLYLQYDEKYATLYIKPNDKITIEFHPDSLAKNVYTVSGSNSITNQNIRDYNKFKGYRYFNPQINDSTTVEQFLHEVKQEFSKEDSILTEFIKKYDPNDEFINWAQKYIKYRLANSLLLYLWYFDVNHEQLRIEVIDTKMFPVNEDEACVVGSYISHLFHYEVFNYFRDTITTKFIENEDYSAAAVLQIKNILKNEEPGLSRDIMLYNQFDNILEYPFDGSEKIWIKYESSIENKQLLKYLKERKKKLEGLNAAHENILDLKANSKSEMVKNFWETISSKHKGKVLYIDIWATWCGPCRGEIPYAIELHDYYKGKPIEFVNLCLSSNKDDWEKSLEQNHIKSDNYFFSKKETDLFRSELNFRGYPTYMIIDKKGNLINKSAPRPSSGNEIKGILNKLIEQ